MSRKLKRRLAVTGQLTCETPLHVGGLESASSADLTVAVNGGGQFYVPGTSLAGPLRAFCRDVFGEEETNALWGWPPGDTTGGESGHASFVTVEDATIEGATVSEVRDHVGIGRHTGAAHGGIKFDREILPKGTALRFRMIVDDGAAGENKERIDTMVPALLHALADGAIRFGAGKTRGLGKVKLENLAIEARTMDTKAGVLAVLRGGSPKYEPGVNIEDLWPNWKNLAKKRPSAGIEIHWRPIGPLMVKAAADGMFVDSLPLISRTNGGFNLVLPGSGNKGALRAHAERILATVLGGSSDESLGFPEQVERQPLADTLFGARNAEKHNAGPENKDRLAGLSPLSVDDCYSAAPIGQSVLNHMLAANIPENNRRDPLSNWADGLQTLKKTPRGATAGPYLDPAMHAAIDRWTGGASGGALYSVLEPWSIVWEPLVLTLDPARLARRRDLAEKDKQPYEKCDGGETVALAAVALLILTLQDFAKGEIPLGFATTRGMGSVEVTKIEIKATSPADLPKTEAYQDGVAKAVLEAVSGLGAVVFENGKWTLDAAKLKPLQEAWTAYIEAHSTAGGPSRTAEEALE